MRSVLRRADVAAARRATSAIRLWKAPRLLVEGDAPIPGHAPVSGFRHRETAGGEGA